MKQKSTAQVFREANPDLNIIPGGSYPHRRQKKAVKLDEVSHIELPTYIPHPMTQEDWEKAKGETCSRCNQETFTIFDHPLGRVCKPCYLWLQDNWIGEGEEVKAKILDDGRIIVFHAKAKGS
jgi:hypothetical protein